MGKKTRYVILMIMTFFLCTVTGMTAYASDGEYVTITVEAEDDNGTLLYALDTDEAGAFSTANEFTVLAGTGHTIYVKDAAGNITSQEYTPEDTSYSSQTEEEDGRNVNIDVVLDDTANNDYEYAGDLLYDPYDPAEEGQGTTYNKTVTDANDSDAERIFYEVTTDDGEVFYLVIDQRSSSNNVYLLDQVNLSDLRSLAADDSGKTDTEGSSSLLDALNESEDSLITESTSENEESGSKENSIAGSLVMVLLIVLIGGGFYYYKFVYKNKKDEQMDLVDAPDKEDFEVEDEEDDDEVDFGLDENYQDQIMAQLLEDDDEEVREEDSDAEKEQKLETENAPETFSKEPPVYEEEEDEYDDELDGKEDEE